MTRTDRVEDLPADAITSDVSLIGPGHRKRQPGRLTEISFHAPIHRTNEIAINPLIAPRQHPINYRTHKGPRLSFRFRLGVWKRYGLRKPGPERPGDLIGLAGVALRTEVQPCPTRVEGDPGQFGVRLALDAKKRVRPAFYR